MDTQTERRQGQNRSMCSFVLTAGRRLQMLSLTRVRAAGGDLLLSASWRSSYTSQPNEYYCDICALGMSLLWEGLLVLGTKMLLERLQLVELSNNKLGSSFADNIQEFVRYHLQ